MANLDLIWTFVGFFLTILIFSYLFGDNPFFRFASYLFIGVTAGYSAVLLIDQVLLPRLIWPLVADPLSQPVLIIPLVMSIMLLAKLSKQLTKLGNVPMGFLVGVGAAVMVGGSVTGTLFPQAGAAVNAFDFSTTRNPLSQWIEGSVLLLGTITTLVYFQFSSRSKPNQPPKRSNMVELLSKIGSIFIAITLGALYAGVFAAAIASLIDRLDFLIETLFKVL
jgi:hypothetical protein